MTKLSFSYTAPLIQNTDGTIRIADSRVTLDSLINAFQKGATAEQIQDSFPSLSLPAIYGAIAWYLDHQDQAKTYLTERRAEAVSQRHEIENQPNIHAFRERIRTRRSQLIKS